jgi:hypothetical protein
MRSHASSAIYGFRDLSTASSSPSRSQAQAQRWLDEVTASVVRGDYVDPETGKVSFRQWFARWSDVQNWTAGTKETADMTLACRGFADVRCIASPNCT